MGLGETEIESAKVWKENCTPTGIPIYLAVCTADVCVGLPTVYDSQCKEITNYYITTRLIRTIKQKILLELNMNFENLHAVYLTTPKTVLPRYIEQ